MHLSIVALTQLTHLSLWDYMPSMGLGPLSSLRLLKSLSLRIEEHDIMDPYGTVEPAQLRLNTAMLTEMHLTGNLQVIHRLAFCF